MTLPQLMIVTRGEDPGALFEVLDTLDTLGSDAIVQLRDKEASAAELETRARALAPRCVLSINVGGPAIDWRAAGARFVHLPESAGLAGDLPRGRSVHSVEAARREAPESAYLVAGPIWPSVGKPDALGLEALKSICAVAENTPVFAIGGILDFGRARAALAAGAHGVAGIRAFAGPLVVELARLISGSAKHS